MLVAIDNNPAGVIAVKDPIKESAKDAIQYFQDNGISVVMLTGDNPITAKAVAAEVGISEFRAEVLPCLLYTSPSPRDRTRSRMPSSA